MTEICRPKASLTTPDARADAHTMTDCTFRLQGKPAACSLARASTPNRLDRAVKEELEEDLSKKLSVCKQLCKNELYSFFKRY